MPPDPIISYPLAKDWLARLLKLWTTLRKERQAELEEIRNVFADPELLAKTYIEPDCQRTNPAEVHEDEPMRTFRQPIRDWLNPFLDGEFFERDGRNTVFVLSDAGMGKSSLLMMLQLTHLLRFWPGGVDLRLLKLGPETLGVLEGLEYRSSTVLLLDALDEDPAAWGRFEERIQELLHIGKSFRQVILTCRTQFFPKGGRTPIETPEKVEVAGFVCNLVYLSPFSDEQVEAYLRKVYPGTWADRLRKWLTDRDSEELERARKVVLPMRSLRMRPMLLAYLKDLVEAEVENWSEYAVYETLVDHWLLREKRKHGLEREELWRACRMVALHLQAAGQRELTPAQLEELLAAHPVAGQLQQLDVGGRSLLNRKADGSYRFAHYSIQEFLAVHALVSEGEELEPAQPLRVTDQVQTFLRSWLAAAPEERLARVPWRHLDFAADRGLDLSVIDLHGIELPRQLRGAKLAGCDLHGTQLQESDLREADLRKAHLREAHLRRADLREADLSGADLSGADLSGADLSGADLSGADLSGADLSGADARGARNERHGIELVFVPGGDHTLGAKDIDADSRPVHRVLLSPFWLGKHPVTHEQYRHFLEAVPGQKKPELWDEKSFNHPQQPVVGVSWDEACAFCEWAGGELPSEAQWEAAARGTDQRPYPWGSHQPTAELANFDGNVGKTTPIGSYPAGAGPFGTQDQAGNVWEWCLDVWNKKAYTERDGQHDPVATSGESVLRVVRGGAWDGPPRRLRAAFRFGRGAGNRFRFLGFRVVFRFGPEP